MAFDNNSIRFLLKNRREGVDFTTLATLGRQKMIAPVHELRWAFRQEGMEPVEQQIPRWLGNEGNGEDGYADAFLRYLGARDLDSIDATPFEGATILHDLNRPVSSELTNRFSCLLDGGTLEHVFNLPLALLNCLRMVREGGHFLAISPANNFFGHSFYQFSPELWWTVLSEGHGFRMEAMLAAEVRPRPRWFEVPNASASGRLLQFSSLWPMLLLVRARRIGPVPVTVAEMDVQQSFYEHEWRGTPKGAGEPQARPRLTHRLKSSALRAAARCGIPPSLLRPVSKTLPRFRGSAAE